MREFSFPVVSLGSRRESAPDVHAVAKWISARRGQTGDLISYELETLLKRQIPHAAFPAAGGEFYDERLMQAFGVRDRHLIQAFELNMSEIAGDMAVVFRTAKGCRFSVPSPLSLEIADEYYKDVDEFQEAAADIFLRFCREQRDAGASGHILLSDAPADIELEAFRGRKFLWMCPSDQLERVLEVSRDIVITGDDAGRLEELADSYALRNIYLCDADTASLLTALETVDTDHLFAAGYAPAGGQEEYWRSLAELKVKMDTAE